MAYIHTHTLHILHHIHTGHILMLLRGGRRPAPVGFGALIIADLGHKYFIGDLIK